MGADSDARVPAGRAFIAAWLGWAFDGLDGYLYVLVATPFVAALLDRAASDPDVTRKGAIIQAAFLLGWAIGGAVFGRLGDRLGRARTLTITILVYALFTGLSSLAQTWWHLLIFRFIAALGIGGEWAAGAALVAETMRPRHRAWSSAALQSAYMVGMMLAAGTVGVLGEADPRWVFLIGVLPAAATLWIRRNVPEPPEWRDAAGREPIPPVSALFRPGLRSTTLLTFVLTSILLTTVWAFMYFGLQAVRAMPAVADWPRARVNALVMQTTILYALVNIAGNFCSAYTARLVGYRLTLMIWLSGAAASVLIGYSRPLTPANVGVIMGAVAFFSLGVFGIFPMYLPALFPTLVRTLGAGVCYNAGRVIAAVGILFGAAITQSAGGHAGAVWWTGLLYLPAIGLAAIMPRGEPTR